MKFRYTVIAVIFLLILLMAMFITGAMKEGITNETTPLVVALIAIVSSVIPSLLNLIKTEQVNRKVEDTDEKVTQVKDDIENGVLQKKIENAIRKVQEEDKRKGDKHG